MKRTQVMTKRFLAPLVLLTLGACAQGPAPTDLATAHTRQSFSTPEYDLAWALARHGFGAYVVGETYGNLSGTQEGNGDAFIRKYDSNGSVLWGRQFGTTEYDSLREVASDANGNVYAAGLTFGSLRGSPAGGFDVFLRKYSASGRALWTRQFGSESDDYINGVAARGPNVYIVGETYNPETGGSVGFVKKFSSSGSVLWSKTRNTSLSDQPVDVALDGDGNVYVVSITIVEQGYVNVIYKYTPAGSLVWEKQLDLGEYGLVRAVAASGRRIFVAGSYSGEGSNYSDVRVIMLRPSGAVVWRHEYGGDISSEDVSDIDAYGDGVVFGGSRVDFEPIDDNGYVSKISPNGTLVWSKILGTPDFDTTTSVLNSSYGVFAAGYTGGALGGTYKGKQDAYIARLRGGTGNTVWIKQ